MKVAKGPANTSKVRKKVSVKDPGQENFAPHFSEKWNEIASQERSNWLSKPRLDTSTFIKFREFSEITSLSDQFFRSPIDVEKFQQSNDALLKQIANIKQLLTGDEQRFEQLAQLSIAFRESPSIEKYTLIRKNFPELDIQVSMSGGIDPLFAIEEECEQHGIPARLVASAMDAFEPAVDRLCLILIDRLTDRSKITGPGAVQRRRQAISDAMVNYLIAFMLEGVDWADVEFRLPASLILLIRYQLGQLKGDYHQAYESRELKIEIARFVGQQLPAHEKLSINRLVGLVGKVRGWSVSRSTAAKWLKDKEFQKWFEFSRQIKQNPEQFQLKLRSRESHQK